MRDVAAVVADEKINMSAVSAVVHKDQTATVWCTLEVSGLDKLSRVLGRIEGMRDVYEVVRERRTIARANPGSRTLLEPLRRRVRDLDGKPSARHEQRPRPAKNRPRLRDVLEDIGHRDRVEAASFRLEGVNAAVMNSRGGRRGSKRGGAGIQLEALDFPSSAPRQNEKTSRMRSDVEQPPARRPYSSLELPQNVVEDQILVSGLMLASNPLLRPALIVEALEIARDGRKLCRLAKTADGTPHDWHCHARIGGHLRILSSILREIEYGVVHGRKRRCAADPTLRNGRERRRHDSMAAAISAAIWSHDLDASRAANRPTRVRQSDACARHARRLVTSARSESGSGRTRPPSSRG